MANSDNSPVWKKVYPIVTGKTFNVSSDIVEDILKLYKQQLVNNLLEYKPYTKKSFKTWKEESGLKELVVDDEMCNFIHLLSKEIDLAVDITWTVICNFLMFEYYGKVDELKSIIRYDTNVRYFVDNIWYFYSADRMFLLKTLKFIFEMASNNTHIFHDQFKKFLNSLDLKLLWKNLLKSLEFLINEVDKDKAQLLTDNSLRRLINRNHREQAEVILLLLHTAQHCKLTGNELEETLSLFLMHGFTRHLIYPASTQISREKDLLEIKNAEIGCILAIMNKYWSSPSLCQSLSQKFVKNLELLQLDAKIILFTWSILRTSIEETQESLDYCNLVTSELIKKNIFGALYELIVHEMYKDCVAGDIVVDAVFKLTCEFIKLCADFDLFDEKITISHLISELLKRKGMIVLESLGPAFQVTIDAFPFVFNPFLELCKSLIQLPGNYDTVMKLLQNIPGILTEMPWTDHRDSLQTVQAQKLFADSDTFIIPRGTIVKRFNFQGMELTRFLHPFSFFTLMEQFTKSLTSNRFQMETDWYCYDNVSHMTQVGYKFIIELLKHYEGDFKSDMTLKRLTQHLEILSAQIPESSPKHYEFVRLYFEVTYTMISCKLLDFSEAFPPFVRKKIFPQALNYDKVSRHMIFNQIHNGSILFRNLKFEEGRQDHSFLLLYLRLVQDMIEDNQYYEEVQIIGMWYILNVVFPFYQQWSYGNPEQMTQICKICCSVFVTVLQRQLTNSTGGANEVFKICLHAFMHEEMIMSSYLAVFLKDKYYLQNLMEQETNWSSGPLLENLECIRLQLILLLLLLKHRSLKPDIKYTIDDKISIISKAVSAYMVNPYNVSLRILSCRFLEVLSRDENIPLMALLGLDYDQVQRLFLDRLRDPTEDDDLKLHILDLISTCIFSQHGMTAAFFNVKRSRKWYSDSREKTIEGDTVSDFMVDYLQNIKKSHEYLRSPLQVGILHCMANLWMCGKQHLIKDVIALDAFWPLLAEPLFREYNQTPKVYAQILKIFSIQLGEVQKDSAFLSSVEKFVTNEKQLELWQQYILNIFKTENTKEEYIEERRFVLKSWMEFLIMLDKKTDLKKFSSKTKQQFIEMSFVGVSYKLVNMYCLDTWIELCLVQISCWGFKDNPNLSTIEKAINMLAVVKLQFSNLNCFSRSAVLAIIQIILRQLKPLFEENTMDLINFVEEVGFLLNHEYDVMEEDIFKTLGKNDSSTKEFTLPWMMCLNILNILLQYKNVEGLSIWLSFNNFLPKIVKTVSQLLNYNQTLPLVKLAIRTMVLYVESPLYFDFLNINLTKFYAAIEPSLSLLLSGQCNKVNPVHLEEGWITATILMKFNQAYLKKFQHYALNTCYSFITIHEQILQHIFSIPESTVALRALDLLINTLAFFDSILVNWQLEWYRKSNITYNFIINGMKKVINACLYTILRPKNILVYMLDNHNRLTQVEKIPIELMVGIMNKLITAAGIGFSILYKINPSLIDLPDVYIPDTMTELISNDFSVPRFELPIPYDLNYSMLLCLVHFLCKTLDALNAEKNTPAVETPKTFYSKCFGLVEHQDYQNISPNQKLSSFLRYAMYEYSGLADPWIQKLNYQCVNRCLETLMTFLSQQMYLSINTADCDMSPYFKRNLESELQFFHEYVKKHTSVLFSQEVSTPQPGVVYKTEMDLIKRYMLRYKGKGNTKEVVDKNFSLVISHWLTNICKLK